METRKYITFFVAVFIAACKSDVVFPPEDTAVQEGGVLRVNCTVDDPSSPALWAVRFVGSNSETNVYTYQNNEGTISSEFEDMFEVQDLHNLVSHTTTYAMAGHYKCTIVGVGDPHQVEVMTMGGIVCPEGVTYDEGEEVSLVCGVSLTGALDPTLTWYHNHQPLDNLYLLSSPVQDDATVPHYVQYGANFTASRDQNMWDFECRLRFPEGSDNSMPPTYTDTCNTSITVNFGASDMAISPEAGLDDIIQVVTSETINCTARGQPEPEVVWNKVSGPADVTSVVGNQLPITADMVGRNVFNCTAWNTFNGTEVYISTLVTFDADLPHVDGASDIHGAQFLVFFLCVITFCLTIRDDILIFT